MIHIYTAVSCQGPIFLCESYDPGSTGHSQMSYLYNYAREHFADYARFDYCPECAREVPEMQKDLALLATTDL